jgi:hypothetical protein
MNRKKNIKFKLESNGEVVDVENIYIIPCEDVIKIDSNDIGVITNIQIDSGSSGFIPFKFRIDYNKIKDETIIIDNKLNIQILIINFQEKKILNDNKWNLYNLDEVMEIYGNIDEYPLYREKYCLIINKKKGGWFFKIESILNKREFDLNRLLSLTVKEFLSKYR